ncbi:MAG: NADH:ubiquinone oxidoreductase subunit N, partial [Anaerolineae bacterium]|nr:NADH:ubiquinone oxidoreductase subunit N [Anaerolineae bacterium]
FFGKFFLFQAAVDSGLTWLAIVGVLNALVALYYYLMVVKVMYVDRSADEEKPLVVSTSAGWAMAIAALGVLVLGVIASPFYNWALQAGQSLLY